MINMFNFFFIQKIRNYILSSSDIIRASVLLAPNIEKSIHAIVKCFKKGNKIVLFGNGGSAADAQHIAAELIGRFSINRKSLPAIAFTTDTSIITSIANDYGYDKIFERQCESLVKEGDVVLAISTSGTSKNVILGAKMAKKNGVESFI